MIVMKRLRTTRLTALTLGAALLFAGSLITASSVAQDEAEEPDQNLYAGRAAVYENLAPKSLEHITSPERIKLVATGQVAPTEIWRALEHGERVECLSCIPDVATLLYHEDSRAREISAWWLRRRIFGVFGVGQVYSQVIQTLGDQSATALQRAYAAEAVGEFLTHAGVPALATAVRTDSSELVRASAVTALRRMNSEGADGELAFAMSDSAEVVRLAALDASMRVHSFTGVEEIVLRLDDSSAAVRRSAVEALGMMRVGDAVYGLIALTAEGTEPDANVRKAAVASLAMIGDPAASDAITQALNDSDLFVRNAAKMARNSGL